MGDFINKLARLLDKALGMALVLLCTDRFNSIVLAEAQFFHCGEQISDLET